MLEDVLQEIYIKLKYLSIYIYPRIKHIPYLCPLCLNVFRYSGIFTEEY